MSKVLKEGWHDYEDLSIYVDERGLCWHGVVSSSSGYKTVRPYKCSSDGLDAVTFKAYSGAHLRYYWT